MDPIVKRDKSIKLPKSTRIQEITSTMLKTFWGEPPDPPLGGNHTGMLQFVIFLFLYVFIFLGGIIYLFFRGSPSVSRGPLTLESMPPLKKTVRESPSKRLSFLMDPIVKPGKSIKLPKSTRIQEITSTM